MQIMAVVITIGNNTHVQHAQGLESLCWMNSGKEFAASFSNGVIEMWSLKDNDKPYDLVTPHGTYIAIIIIIQLHNEMYTK